MGKKYTIDFTFEEMKIFFLRKKQCKICKVKLKRVYDKTYMGKGRANISLLKYSFLVDETEVKIKYECGVCGKMYELKDL